MIPKAWMQPVKMDGIVCHWSAGGHKVSSVDREHYHVIWGGDGVPVKGDHDIADNVFTGDDDYAAHTRAHNTRIIGVAVASMLGAVEKPFKPGSAPTTKKQWDAMVEGVAELATFYKIPVTPRTILTHAEVQGTLGKPQRGKWDFTRLAFDLSVVGAKACGDRLRAEVLAKMGTVVIPEPAVVIPEPALHTTEGVRRVIGVFPETLNFRARPGTAGEIKGELHENTVVELIEEGPGWSKVRSPQGFIGWVASRYLKDASAPKE